MTEREAEAQKLEAEANVAEARAAESFARCDTDGFLSQWASGLTAQLKRRQADLLRAGNVAPHLGLFDAEGRRLKARLVSRKNPYSFQWESVWVLLGVDNRAIGWVTSPKDGFAPSKRSKMGRLCLHEDYETVRSRAEIRGSGTGLAGAATCHVSVVRDDDGYPEGAAIWDGWDGRDA